MWRRRRSEGSVLRITCAGQGPRTGFPLLNVFLVYHSFARTGRASCFVSRAVARSLAPYGRGRKKRLGDAPKPPQRGCRPLEPCFFPTLQQPWLCVRAGHYRSFIGYNVDVAVIAVGKS